MPPPRPLDRALVTWVSLGGCREGTGRMCPLDYTGLCLCYVGSKSYFCRRSHGESVLTILVFFKILQCVFRCISAFVFLCIGLCLDRPILHFGGLALVLSIRFAAPQTVMLLKGSLRPCLEYFIITLVVVVVGFAGVTIRKLSFA